MPVSRKKGWRPRSQAPTHVYVWAARDCVFDCLRTLKWVMMDKRSCVSALHLCNQTDMGMVYIKSEVWRKVGKRVLTGPLGDIPELFKLVYMKQIFAQPRVMNMAFRA